MDYISTAFATFIILALVWLVLSICHTNAVYKFRVWCIDNAWEAYHTLPSYTEMDRNWRLWTQQQFKDYYLGVI